jgi:hypothetical protein
VEVAAVASLFSRDRPSPLRPILPTATARICRYPPEQGKRVVRHWISAEEEPPEGGCGAPANGGGSTPAKKGGSAPACVVVGGERKSVEGERVEKRRGAHKY